MEFAINAVAPCPIPAPSARIMKKIGKYVAQREQHDAIILIGNMKTKLWKKANGLANVTEIIEVLDGVINDDGSSE